jgi:hypothetical protein
VEIDETKMGKMKYGRGHPVRGVWVVVAVCREVRFNISNYFLILNYILHI